MKKLLLLSCVAVIVSLMSPCIYGQAHNSPVHPEVHYRHSSYWTTADGFQSAVQLHNNLVNYPLTLVPVLYQSDGSSVELAPIGIPALGNASLDIGANLARKGLPTKAEGSMVFRYTGRISNALSAETLITQAQKSLSYTIPSYEERPSSLNLHFAWWKPSPGAEVYVALQNTSDGPIQVHPSVRMGDHNFKLKSTLLGSHQLRKLHLPDDLDHAGQALWATSEVGGVSLSFDGPASALNTSGWVEDEALGFSTMLSFHDPAMAASHELLGTQILLGPQPGMPGQSGDYLDLSSYLVLRNVTNHSVGFFARFIYERAGAQTDVLLPLASLAAQEIRSVDLSGLQKQGIIPQDVRSGSIRMEYFADNGAVMGRVFSASQDRKYGFYTALESFAGLGGSGVYWTIDGTWNTLLTVTNFGEQADAMNLALTYAGGTFTLPAIPLAPLQSKTFSLRDIANGSTLAMDGKKWPAGINSGGYKLLGKGLRSRLLIKEQAIDTAQKLATPYYVSIIYVSECFAQSTFEVTVGGTADVTPKALAYIYGDPAPSADTCPTNAYIDQDATVTSDTTSVATVSADSSGNWTLTGVSASTATLTAQTGPRPIDPFPGGATQTFQAQATVNVAQGVVSISGDPGIPKSETSDYVITVTPAQPIQLSLIGSGSGTAQFTVTGSTVQAINGSQTVTIRGMTASSRSNDILLQAATPQGTILGFQNISVVSVSINIRGADSEAPSTDNSALSRYSGIVGSNHLGSNVQPSSPNKCVEGVELVGTVTPSDYTRVIELRRNIVSARAFTGRRGTARDQAVTPTPGPDNSDPNNRDDDPQSGGSSGKVYDLDAPGIGPQDPTVIARLRHNFHEYAAFPGSNKELGHLDWFSRESCRVSTSGPALAEFVNDVPGDNMAGTGPTRLTWNLR